MYQAGWSRRDIGIVARGYAMHGYGNWTHRAYGQRTPLYARAIVLQDQAGRSAILCCLDLGYVTQAMRAGASARLCAAMGEDFDEAAFVLTCTHTHSGPGGCTHDALYNLVTPGFVPEHLERVIEATVSAVLEAWRSRAPTELSLAEGCFDDAAPVAWNRALAAYNRNPGITRRSAREAHLALDRRMQLLSLRRGGRVEALLSLFGVHATCLGTALHLHDGDNKGYAAAESEAALAARGATDPVAIFAQGTAGDVSPHYHGPGQAARRRALRGEAEVAYARDNGRLQSRLALNLLEAPATPVAGPIDAVLRHVDFADVHADPVHADGEPEAWTSPPCHGVSFYAGTPVDEQGVSKLLCAAATVLAGAVKRHRLARLERYAPDDRAYFRRLYAAQGAKAVLVDAGRKEAFGQPLGKVAVPVIVDPVVGEMKRQARCGAFDTSALLPTCLPLQVMVIGGLALVCAPGEFTTVAGERLRGVVDAVLRERMVHRSLLMTYCNDYMGYVTTREEYQLQTYEGGHTVFGQWTLAAFLTRYAALAGELLIPRAARRADDEVRPAPVPADELALRTATAPPGADSGPRVAAPRC